MRLTPLIVLTTLAFAACSALASAQPSAPPTRVAAASTQAEDAAIGAGTKLHDEGKYDQAIAKYEEVLKLSPTNMTALYELAFSFAASKEYEKSLAAAIRGTEYDSPLLPMFYDLVGAAYDSMGEPQKAIETYKKGIQIVPSDAALLYYNMGVTYLESLKNNDEARQALKKAVALNPQQPDFQVMLGQVFQNGGYRTPALFAFATYLVYAPTGPRAIPAIGFFRALLRGGTELGKSAGAASADPGAPARTDEGDFSDFERAIAASHQTVIAEMDKGAEELPTLLTQVNGLLTLLAARRSDRDHQSFAGAHYLPFFVELQQKGYVEPFVYWVIQRAPVTGAREWISGHQDRVREFVTWARGYQWPKP